MYSYVFVSALGSYEKGTHIIIYYYYYATAVRRLEPRCRIQLQAVWSDKNVCRIQQAYHVWVGRGVGGWGWTCSLYVGKCYKLAVRQCAATWPHSDAQGDGVMYTTSSSGDHIFFLFFFFFFLCLRSASSDDTRGVRVSESQGVSESQSKPA